MAFPQLRVRTEYSFRNAYGPVKRIAEVLNEIECGAAGCVDSKGTWAHVSWEKELKKTSCVPMFGTEFELSTDDDRRPVWWCLAEDLKQFYRLSSNPPKTAEEIAAAKGVVRFAGAALTDPDTFDYIDINPRSRLQGRKAIELSKSTGKPLVLTSDNLYPSPDDLHRFLAWNDSRQMTPQHILKQHELRKALWWMDNDTFRQAVNNTYEVAERCSGLKLAVAPIISVDGDLASLVEQGKKYRMERGHIPEWTDVYQKRLERELELIAEKEYESYFIVVADLVQFAKTKMLVGPGRGSSSGSLVCFLLQITEVDPLPHNLIFERFIDVNRHDLPDIDIDFADSKRHLVFEYLGKKYGTDNVAHIGTVSRLKPRSVINHVGKKLGIPHGAAFPVINVLLEHSSGDARYGKALEDTLEQTRPGQEFIERYPEASLMAELEEHASHSGVHAAGIIVSNVPVVEHCTVRDGIAHIDKKDAEYLNLLKIDALGLRTLGVIEDTSCVTSQQMYDLKLNDPAVFKVFNDQKYSGIFQFEGAAQRRVSMQVEIKSFQQIDHVTALARPGPLGGGAANKYIQRAAGKEPVEKVHPLFDPLVVDTMGVILYQEQTMQIVRTLGQFSWEDTSFVRKAMSGRKGDEHFAKKRVQFIEGCVAQDIDKETASTIWAQMATMGSWTMNRCVVGSTMIKLACQHTGLGSVCDIATLYDRYIANPTPWTRQRMNKGFGPQLLAFDGEAAKRAYAKNIFKTGKKPCVKVTMSDGSEVECTLDHKFIINGKWQRLSVAKVGDEILFVERKKWVKPLHNAGRGKDWRKGRKVAGAIDMDHGRALCVNAFKARFSGSPCEDCGADCPSERSHEVHHNDHNQGLDRPDDLAWLCSSCHKKRHMAAGDWLPPMGRGWLPVNENPTIASIEDIGEQETYDIEMVGDHHNYVLANGMVAHNSHTVSYGVISYWCGYMKAYHPIEYAASCLRHAKDDEQVIEILRELTAEGVPFTAFDPDKSDVNWTAKDGRLIGGFQNLIGVGPVKANYYVQKRDNEGLSDDDKAKLAKLKPKQTDLQEGHTLWGHLYADPDRYMIAGPIKQFAEMENMEQGVVICKMLKADRRDENEGVLIAKRGGEVKPGQTLFLDLDVVDDSVSKSVTARIRPWLWHTYGQEMADGAQPGDWFLMRGKWLKEFSMFIVRKVKCLNRDFI